MNDMTFHCALILNNNEDCNCEIACIVTHVMNKTYHAHDGQPYSDQRRARIAVLSEFLRAYVEEQVDAEAEHGYNDPITQELILGALQEISFREIAENLIGDYSPKSPEETAEDEEFFNVMGFSNFDINED